MGAIYRILYYFCFSGQFILIIWIWQLSNQEESSIIEVKIFWEYFLRVGTQKLESRGYQPNWVKCKSLPDGTGSEGIKRSWAAIETRHCEKAKWKLPEMSLPGETVSQNQYQILAGITIWVITEDWGCREWFPTHLQNSSICFVQMDHGEWQLITTELSGSDSDCRCRLNPYMSRLTYLEYGMQLLIFKMPFF